MAEPTNVVWKITPQVEGAESVDRLADQFDRMSDAEDKAGKEAEDFAKRQKAAGDAAKKAGDDIGRTTPKVQALGSSIKASAANFAAFAGIDATVRGVFQVIRQGTDTIVGFEEELANLSSLTGATGGDLEFLANQAKGVGIATTVSATDAVKAFTAIGSARPDLLANKEALAAVTKEAIALSEAAKIDLATAGKAVAGAMNQFNLPASDAARIVNVLAAGSKEGAADVGVLGESIDKVGTVLAANNVSLEEGTALLETLADKELKGAQAGTQLRNVVLRLVQAGKGFSTGQFNVNEALEETRKEFEAIPDPVDRAEAAIKMFGLESVTAGNILLDNIDRYQSLTEAVTDSSVAYEQQATNTSTVSAALARLRNTVDSVFLSFSNSTGIMRKGIDFLSRNLLTFLKLFGVLTTAILTYITYTKLASAASTAWAAATRLVSVATALFSGGIKGATEAVKGFNATVKASPVGLLLSLLALATTAFFAFRDSATEAAEAQRELNRAEEEGYKQRKAMRDADQTINQRVNNAPRYSKEQLQTLKQDIDAQIEEYNRLQSARLDADANGGDAAVEQMKKTQAAIAEVEDAYRKNQDKAKDVQILNLRSKLQRQLEQEKAAYKTQFAGLSADQLGVNRDFLAQQAAYVDQLIANIDKQAAGAVESLEALEKRRQELQEKRDKAPIGSAASFKADAELDSVVARIEAVKKSFDNISKGTLKDLQDQRDKLLKRLQENLVFGSEAYAKTFDDYVKAAKLAKEAEEKLKLPDETFAEGSIAFFEQQLSALNDQVKRLPEGQLFDELATKIAAAEAKLKALKDKLKTGDPDEEAKKTKDRNLAILDEEKRHTLAISELDKDKHSERLKLELDFERERLAIMEKSGVATEEELKAQKNKIKELSFSVGVATNDEDKEAFKKLATEVIDISEQIAQAGIAAWGAWTDAAIASTEAQMQAQERRVEEALKIAEKGNAVLYEEEKKRMDKLTAERKRQAEAQSLIAQAEVFANSAVAISRAAVDGGGFASAVTISATVLALVAGLAKARTLSSGLSFYKGGEANWMQAFSARGGYTGDGNARSESNAVGPKPYTYHRKEYIVPHEVVAIGQNRRILERVHRGRMDMSQMFQPKVIKMVYNKETNNYERMAPNKDRTDEVIDAIRQIPAPYFRVDSRGFTYGVTRRAQRAAAFIKDKR
jgi:TP901 family phage tail tape measure protein